MNLRFVAALAVASLALAGCLSSEPESTPEEPVDLTGKFVSAMEMEKVNSILSSEWTVSAAVSYANDLYEPTMEVSDSGVIYVTGHTILVDTTGAPVFASYDDGESWTQLPYTGEQRMPGDIHGATPPPSDEIFLVAGDDGYLYGVDITLGTFPVNAWSRDGNEHVYHNPNAYDREESTTRGTCSAASLNDRPWAAYGDGKLLMVNNPGGGPMQIGVMDVPVELPVGAGGPVVGPEWNTCASTGGFIPGIPDMRDDHFFAVPQIENGKLHVVIGNATNIQETQQLHVMDVDNSGGGTTNYGHVVFDAEGTMYVGVRNNDDAEEGDGRISIAVSRDDGQTFQVRHFDVEETVTSIYLDGNMAGPGMLLTWAEDNGNSADWFAAHVFVGPHGAAVVEEASLMLEDGPLPSAHVQGAGAGPDGRAYLVMDYGTGTGTTPLTIVRQDGGPTLPVVTPVLREQMS